MSYLIWRFVRGFLTWVVTSFREEEAGVRCLPLSPDGTPRSMLPIIDGSDGKSDEELASQGGEHRLLTFP